MKHLNERELKKLLTPGSAPEPPAGLAERIKAEIPDAIEVGPAPAPGPPEVAEVRPFRRPSPPALRGLLLAATLLTAVGAAFLVSRVSESPPLEVVWTDSKTLPAEASQTAPIPEAAAAAPEAVVSPGEIAAASEGQKKESPKRQLAGGRAERNEAADAPRSRADATLVLRDARADDDVSRGRRRTVVPPNAPSAPPAPSEERVRLAEEEQLRSRLQSLGYLAGTEAAEASTAETERVNVAGQLRMELKRVAPSAPAPPSTGGTAEPNDQPYGDVFFQDYGTNPFVDTEDDRLSTFGLDVDTASYAVVRRFLTDGHRPPRDAVRVEELVNYFDYGDAPPEEEDFAIHAEGAPSPFGQGERYYLLRFHLRGRDLDAAERRPANLTFVVDVSGSMARENRLVLVQRALGLLIDELRPDDRVALVVYGTSGRVLLEHTADHGRIRRAIDELVPEGSTNAEEGLRLGYRLAERALRAGTINRVVLCSDGVANVGRTGAESILEAIASQARRGVELTTVGFGMGNYNDVLMEQLADSGNGRYAYVDTLEEARRIFVEDLTGTLQTIAAEARAQVDFNPEVVSRYRLVGYENRDIADERFRDDTVDAGEIGAGHAVTALYEVKLHRPPARRDEVATLRLRYGSILAGEMVELSRRVRGADFSPRFEDASPALQLTAVVAEFGEILKGSYWARGGDLDDLVRRAQRLSAEYPGDHEVVEFVTLVSRAARLR